MSYTRLCTAQVFTDHTDTPGNWQDRSERSRGSDAIVLIEAGTFCLKFYGKCLVSFICCRLQDPLPWALPLDLAGYNSSPDWE